MGAPMPQHVAVQAQRALRGRSDPLGSLPQALLAHRPQYAPGCERALARAAAHLRHAASVQVPGSGHRISVPCGFDGTSCGIQCRGEHMDEHTRGFHSCGVAPCPVDARCPGSQRSGGRCAFGTVNVFCMPLSCACAELRLCCAESARGYRAGAKRCRPLHRTCCSPGVLCACHWQARGQGGAKMLKACCSTWRADGMCRCYG